MSDFRKVLLSILVGLVTFYFLVVVGLSLYDASVKKKVLRMVAAELSPNATVQEMDAFMRRHTVRYAFDQYNSEFSGFLQQNVADEYLADRQVGIILKVNTTSKTLERTDVQSLILFFNGRNCGDSLNYGITVGITVTGVRDYGDSLLNPPIVTPAEPPHHADAAAPRKLGLR